MSENIHPYKFVDKETKEFHSGTFWMTEKEAEDFSMNYKKVREKPTINRKEALQGAVNMRKKVLTDK
mgnify:CR=1 FL=1